MEPRAIERPVVPHIDSRTPSTHTPGTNGKVKGRPARLILIAERDRSVRDLQRFFLERDGFAVEFAEDGQAALERAAVARPAAIVTEILVPRLDGLTLCRRLRDDPATREIPVIVFSILSAAARAADAGASAFLRKPIVEASFVAAIQHAIAAKSSASTE